MASGRRIDQLYAQSREQFTEHRNALAKQLRSEGDRAAAEQVAQLKKPTVAAWLANQLAHHHRDQLGRFLAAADDLRQAQDEALRGEGGEHLRRAAKAEREAIERLVGTARSVGGRPAPATLDRVRETLEAAVADPQARDALEGGRLERELRPGMVPASPASKRAAKTGGGTKADDRTKKEVAAAERELAHLGDQLQAAEREEGDRQWEVDEAEERLRDARLELRGAREATKQLRGQVRSAQRRLDRTRR